MTERDAGLQQAKSAANEIALALDREVDLELVRESARELIGLLQKLLGQPLQTMELVEDPARVRMPETGFPVRAKRALPNGERWGPVDMAHLTRESLLAWLRSRPELAENVVLLLLGHER